VKNKATSAEEILQEIAIKAKVAEGKESIRKILREIYRNGSLGTKSLAKKVYLPIPTIAAIRNELEKKELISRSKHGAILTEKGLAFVMDELQLGFTENLQCKRCHGRTIEPPTHFEQLITEMKHYTALRPKPLTEFDQAFGRPITALNRAFLMLEYDDIEGRNILLLGDDDFTSIAIALLQLQTQITVIDIDSRLLQIITEIASEKRLPINCVEHDLLQPLPRNLQKRFDVVVLDPPYTNSGLRVFLSRAIQALKPEANRRIYLAFAHRPPKETKALQNIILESGLVFTQLLPGFNLYEGAEMHGNISSMAILTTTEETKAPVQTSFQGKIYTGELNPTIRTYRCRNNHEIPIGRTEEIHTIEELKEQGCPICGSKEQFTLIKRASPD